MDNRKARLSIFVCAAFLSIIVSMSQKSHVVLADSFSPNCSAGTLASPDLYTPYTVDYYVNGLDIQANSDVAIYLSAYGLQEPDPAQASPPLISGVSVLDANYQPIVSNDWSISGLQCTRGGTRSTQYGYLGHWHASLPQGMDHADYRLTVTFTFTKTGSSSPIEVQYFINLHVATSVASPQSVHWQTMLSSDGSSLESKNGAYDLTRLPNIMTANTSFFFQNPVKDNVSFSGGMIDSLSPACDNIFLLPTTGQQKPKFGSFYFDQNPRALAGSSSQCPTFIGSSIQQSGSIANSLTGSMPNCACQHEVSIQEVLQVRDPASQSYIIKAGAYILDQAFSGQVSNGSVSSQIDSIGEGRAFLFYTDPTTPTLDINSTVQNATINWGSVPSSSWNPDELSVTYSLILCTSHTYEDSSLPLPSDCILHSGLSTSWSGSLPSALVHASVEATFSSLQNPTFVINSNNVFSTLAVIPPTPTVTPTNTPIVHGRLTITAKPTAYAWILSGPSDQVGIHTEIYPTTLGSHPDELSWPVGLPLHILPSLSEQPMNVDVLLEDTVSANSAKIYPISITSESYSVDNVCGKNLSANSQVYSHSASFSPYEIEPSVSISDTLAGSATVLWYSGPQAATSKRQLQPCDLDTYLAAQHQLNLTSTGIPLTYTVRQALYFALVVPNGNPPLQSHPAVCRTTTLTIPPPVATLRPVESSVTIPLHNECNVPTIGLRTITDAIASHRFTVNNAEHVVVDPGSFKVAINSASSKLVSFTLDQITTRVLHYHLLSLREVHS